MTKIKLNDRVKHVDGRIGTVVHDDPDDLDVPYFVSWDDGGSNWCRQDAPNIAEVIGHRYFVDTPFEIGKTYETEGKAVGVTVMGVGLLCRSGHGFNLYHTPDGKHVASEGYNLILPALKPEPKPCEGREVEVDGVKYRLVPVESEE